MAQVRDVVAVVDVFSEMTNTKMPVSIGVKVARAIEELERVLKVFNEQRKQIVDKDISDDRKMEQINELLDEEVDIDVDLRVADLEVIGVSMTPGVALAVSRILSKDEGDVDEQLPD